MNAEKTVIGSVLIDKNCICDFYEKLRPEMFSNEFFQECYRTILAMYDRSEDINIVSLSGKLENDKYDMQSISTILGECIIETTSSVLAKSSADAIICEWKCREIKKLFGRVSLLPSDVDDTIAECLTRLEELESNEEHKTMTAKQLVDAYKSEHFNPDVGKNAIRLGFYNLDECLGGLEPGDVMVIGARPAVGKSAFAAQIIECVSEKGKKVGYFNMEMSNKQVYQRFISNISKLSLNRIRRGKAFLGNEEKDFNDANDKLSKLPFEVNTDCRKISTLRVACLHQNYDLIVIDYLQLIQAERKFANRASEVGEISKAIKSLAMELHVPIILLSQLNRTSEHKDTKEPTMAELRESGDIEQDASSIILMWNLSERDKSLKGLKVDKNRMGVTMKEGIKFNGDNMEFSERNESFDKFLNFAREIDKGCGFENADDEDIPFGEDW